MRVTVEFHFGNAGASVRTDQMRSADARMFTVTAQLMLKVLLVFSALGEVVAAFMGSSLRRRLRRQKGFDEIVPGSESYERPRRRVALAVVDRPGRRVLT